MSKTIKRKGSNKKKTRKHGLAKGLGLSILLKNTTPKDIDELSQQINTELTNLDQSMIVSS